jgi:Cu/Ag efflux protein CusF
MRALQALSVMVVVFAFTPSFAQDSRMAQGHIAAADEQAGIVTIKLQHGKTESYRLKDGLLFNAVKPGDAVRFTAQTENGQAVIIKLEKE